jgi:peroxiredoxin
MKRRLTALAFGTALLLAVGAGLATAANEKKPHHGAKGQSAHGDLMVGMSAAEREYLHGHMAAMPPAARKQMLDHMLRMSPAERRRTVQQMMKSRGAGGKSHVAPKTGGHNSHGSHASHGRHGGAGHGKTQVAPKSSGHSSHESHSSRGSHGNHKGMGHAKPHGGEAKGHKPQEAAGLAIGAQVPDFAVRDLSGKTRRLSDLRKETKSGVVSLTFWCSFCHSCRNVESRLDRFARENKDQAVIAAIDASAGETAAGVQAFAKKTKLSLPILLDAPGASADLFGVRATTTTVVIDGKGILRYRGQFQDGERMLAENAVQSVLAGKPLAQRETAQRG